LRYLTKHELGYCLKMFSLFLLVVTDWCFTIHSLLFLLTCCITPTLVGQIGPL